MILLVLVGGCGAGASFEAEHGVLLLVLGCTRMVMGCFFAGVAKYFSRRQMQFECSAQLGRLVWVIVLVY